MNRLFLKVYLGIAIVLVVGTLGTLYIISKGLQTARERAFEERLIDSAEFIKSRVQSENLFLEEEELFQLSRAARMRFRILPSAEGLPDQVQQRLSEGGETFLFADEDGRTGVFSLFMDGQVLIGYFSRRGGDRDGFGFRSDHLPREGFGRSGKQGGRRERAESRGLWRGPDRSPGPPPGGLGAPPWPSNWSQTRNLFLLSAIGIPILLVGPAIYFLIRPLDKRINGLSSVAERFGEGDLDSRVQVVQLDAFGHLARTFNRMADQIKNLVEGQNELLRAVSHELRTPLARLFFMRDAAEEAESPKERQRQLGRIQKTLTEMNDLVDELTTFVRLGRDGEDGEREPVCVQSVLEEVVEISRDLREDLRLTVQCEVDTVYALPRLFKRAVLNLVTNATRHAESGVDIRCLEEREVFYLTVDDDGPGIPAEQRERILKPFIRIDESRSSRIGGIGLGLAIVSRAMAVHDGGVEILDSPMGGARFQLTFPKT